MWDLEYDRAIPPLPQPVGADLPWHAEESLPLGCWLLHVEPLAADDLERNQSWLLYYRGTLRVSLATDLHPRAAGVLASGDLYVKGQVWYETEAHHDAPPPLRPWWPPIFPRDEYRFYVRLTHLGPAPGGKLEIELDTYRLDPRSGEWSAHGRLRGLVARRKAKTWKVRFLQGELANERGTSVARVSLGWVSTYLRRATVEIDRTPGRKLPLFEGPHTLQSTFAAIGWNLFVDPENDEVEEPPGGVWDDKQLHEQMLKYRAAVNFDTEWRYHVLVVDRLCEVKDRCFAVMYDEGATDSNLVPREGLAIAGGSRFPDSPMYGPTVAQKLEDVPVAFLRAVVHELGHAMGLMHNFSSREFMQGTDYIAEDPAGTFPWNILWRFSREDIVLLKHMPDPWVRPGGLPLRLRFAYVPVPLEDITSDAVDQFALAATPIVVSVPLGAPVRVHLRLENRSRREMPGPVSLGLSGGAVGGEVRGPWGAPQPFSSAKLIDGEGSDKMKAGAVMEDDLVLVRGPRGALFPTPGRYEIEVDVAWLGPSGIACVTATASVLVTWPPVDDEQAALAVLASPEIVIPLIFRSMPPVIAPEDRKRLDQGLGALALALQSPTLSPHWAGVAARYRAEQRGGAQVAAVAELFELPAVLAASEVADILAFLETADLAVRGKAVAHLLDALGTIVQDLFARKLCPQRVVDRLTALSGRAGKAHPS